MDAFNYLAVLLSIILGLAITQTLQAYRGLLLFRGPIHGALLPLTWSGLLLLIVTQSWWASFGLRTHTNWTFLEFAVVLLQMALLYMSAAVVLPDVTDADTIDLGAHFERNRGSFFRFLVMVLVVSVLKDVVLSGRFPDRTNLAFHAGIAAAAVLGITLSGKRAQLTLALAMAGAFLAYVTLLFARL